MTENIQSSLGFKDGTVAVAIPALTLGPGAMGALGASVRRSTWTTLVHFPGVCHGHVLIEGPRIGEHDVVGLILNGAAGNNHGLCRPACVCGITRRLTEFPWEQEVRAQAKAPVGNAPEHRQLLRTSLPHRSRNGNHHTQP